MRQKAPVAWMSTKFPLELPAALGLEVYCPESAAAAAAGRGESGALCRLAQDMGYAGDLHRQALFSIGLVLFLFIMLINAVLNIFLKRNKEGN